MPRAAAPRRAKLTPPSASRPIAAAVATPPTWSLPELETSSGCFETMRVYDGRIFRLQAHLDRLDGSARYLGVRLDETFDALGRRLRAAVTKSGIRESIVRVALLPNVERVASPSIVVQAVPLPPAECYRTGIRIAIVPTKKFSVGQIDPHSKFSARLGSIMAVMDAQLRGVDEAIFLDATGSVTESTASNIGIIKRGAFVAPPCKLGLLAGITWQALIECSRAIGLQVREELLTRHDLYNADEVFLSSSIKEIIPVRLVDGRAISDGRPGAQTARLHRAFRELVRRELGVVVRDPITLRGSGKPTGAERGRR